MRINENTTYLPVSESQFKYLFLEYLDVCYPVNNLEWMINQILKNMLTHYDCTDGVNYDKIILKINKLKKRDDEDD